MKEILTQKQIIEREQIERGKCKLCGAPIRVVPLDFEYDGVISITVANTDEFLKVCSEGCTTMAKRITKYKAKQLVNDCGAVI